jgi:hypothetical protein
VKASCSCASSPDRPSQRCVSSTPSRHSCGSCSYSSPQRSRVTTFSSRSRGAPCLEAVLRPPGRFSERLGGRSYESCHTPRQRGLLTARFAVVHTRIPRNRGADLVSLVLLRGGIGIVAVIACQHCGQPVNAIEPANVRTGHVSSSGMPREWVMYEGGEELHRCQSPDVSAAPVVDEWPVAG